MSSIRKTLTLNYFKTSPSAPVALAENLKQDRSDKPANTKEKGYIKWAKKRSQITRACERFTEMEIRLCECKALGSWESR